MLTSISLGLILVVELVQALLVILNRKYAPHLQSAQELIAMGGIPSVPLFSSGPPCVAWPGGPLKLRPSAASPPLSKPISHQTKTFDQSLGCIRLVLAQKHNRFRVLQHRARRVQGRPQHSPGCGIFEVAFSKKRIQRSLET